MKQETDVVVIGGGVGGLSSAILLAGQGLKVDLLERGPELGGKAGRSQVEGAIVDTGPSVLTLPHVFDDIFEAAGQRREEVIELTTPDPGFRYVYQDGVELDVHHQLGRTLDSVREALGSQAARELENYMDHARRIWEAAAPHFVFSAAPEMSKVLFGPPSVWGALTQIEPLRALGASIDKRVTNEHLRMLLRRYATYNGSDARTAPATLGCIAHVELALGGYGVRGGMYSLIVALEKAATKLGVRIHLNTEVTGITVDRGSVSGVKTSAHGEFTCTQVVSNAEPTLLSERLLPGPRKSEPRPAPSMSAYTGIIRAERNVNRPAHTVLFPSNYDNEFADIFDRKQVPSDPTLYLCAQEKAHSRPGWDDDEPIFVMLNAPAVESDAPDAHPELAQQACATLRKHQLINEQARMVWWRTPSDLAARFPGSSGSLYGSASNTRTAAFQRPKNRHPAIKGLYLASGSAHPGGGVPMVALSGKQAARSALEDRRKAA